MQDNVKIILLALVVIVVGSFVSNSLTGNAPKELRGVITCKDTDGGNNPFVGGVVVVSRSGDEQWYPDTCESIASVDSVKEYYCVGGNSQRFRESQCPSGMECVTGTPKNLAYRKYGPLAACK